VLKSRLWATTVRRASAAGMAAAALALGTCSTAPALTRFTLPRMKASGLACSRATSIWSSDTSAGLRLAAMRPAVSPGRTVTCCSPLLSARTGAGACAGADAAACAARARRAALSSGAVLRAARGAGAIWGPAGATGSACAWRVTGGSSSRV